MDVSMAFNLAPLQILWHNKKNSWFENYKLVFFRVSEETKFEVDTTPIILYRLYHFGNVKK